MKKIVVEIDGVRHRLVEGDTTQSCDHCSIRNVCDSVYSVLCDYPDYDKARSRFLEEKDFDLGSPLKVEFDD